MNLNPPGNFEMNNAKIPPQADEKSNLAVIQNGNRPKGRKKRL
jgi:hypothetical protein